VFNPTYTPITIDGIEGLRTSDIARRFEEDNIFLKKDNKIYQITWINTPATKQITGELLNKLLTTVKLL
jgi:hypothetical protein